MNITQYVATRWYRSPELLLGVTDYGPSVDMWAVGCIMGELTDGNPLFAGATELEQLQLIQQGMGPLTAVQMSRFQSEPRFRGARFPPLELVSGMETLRSRYGSKLSADALDFMRGVLHMDPQRRRTARECIEHPWFRGLGDDTRVRGGGGGGGSSVVGVGVNSSTMQRPNAGSPAVVTAPEVPESPGLRGGGYEDDFEEEEEEEDNNMEGGGKDEEEEDDEDGGMEDAYEMGGGTGKDDDEDEEEEEDVDDTEDDDAAARRRGTGGRTTGTRISSWDNGGGGMVPEPLSSQGMFSPTGASAVAAARSGAVAEVSESVDDDDMAGGAMHVRGSRGGGGGGGFPPSTWAATGLTPRAIPGSRGKQLQGGMVRVAAAPTVTHTTATHTSLRRSHVHRGAAGPPAIHPLAPSASPPSQPSPSSRSSSHMHSSQRETGRSSQTMHSSVDAQNSDRRSTKADKDLKDKERGRRRARAVRNSNPSSQASHSLSRSRSRSRGPKPHKDSRRKRSTNSSQPPSSTSSSAAIPPSNTTSSSSNNNNNNNNNAPAVTAVSVPTSHSRTSSSVFGHTHSPTHESSPLPIPSSNAATRAVRAAKDAERAAAGAARGPRRVYRPISAVRRNAALEIRGDHVDEGLSGSQQPQQQPVHLAPIQHPVRRARASGTLVPPQPARAQRWQRRPLAPVRTEPGEAYRRAVPATGRTTQQQRTTQRRSRRRR